jgi:hypothetical protein
LKSKPFAQAPTAESDKSIKLSWTKPEDTLLEAWLSRGDRRMADVIYTAWKNGAKFDAWDEAKNSEAWMPAFEEHGLDPAFYTHRQRRTDEIFPGSTSPPLCARTSSSRISACRSKDRSAWTADLNCFACGILPTFALNLRRENPGEGWKCPDVKTPKREREVNVKQLSVISDPPSGTSQSSVISEQLPMVGD